MNVVYGAGHLPNDVFLIGEAPGAQEFKEGEPFVGRSGREQDTYLSRFNLRTRQFYRTNLCKEYIAGNPDPTPEQIDYWQSELFDELCKCQPKIIIAVGRYAARYFLGDSTLLDIVHGLPHIVSPSCPAASYLRSDCIILPIFHPAGGFYDSDARAVIAWDYEQVAYYTDLIKRSISITPRTDPFLGIEDYREISPYDLGDVLPLDSTHFAIDTEGTPSDPFSLQVSCAPGTGYTLLYDHVDFSIAIAYLQCLVDNGCIVIFHNGLYDIEMLRVMGLNLRRAKFIDTMYMLYLLRIEPQGLKEAAYRWCNIRMTSHKETIEPLGTKRQIEYLQAVIDRSAEWPIPPPRIVIQNDGTPKVKKPKHVSSRAAYTLRNFLAGKVDNKGWFTDLVKWWNNKVSRELRRPVEQALGKIPYGSIRALYAVDAKAAIDYSSRDPDATLRLYLRLSDELSRRGLSTPGKRLTDLLSTGMEVLPVFEEMQSTGMPCDLSRLHSLGEEMQSGMYRIGSELSFKYFDNKPFNPNSPKQTQSLLKKRGLEGSQLTPSGEMSTGKKSIEGLRFVDPAIASLFDWREHSHTKTAFINPVFASLPYEYAGNTSDTDTDTDTDDDDTDANDTEDISIIPAELQPSNLWRVRCQIKNTRTATRRPAAEAPNLLAQPKHSVYGRKLRACYRAPKGKILYAADYSQIEARLLAHETADPFLCELFNTRGADGKPRDIHTETASIIFGVPLDQVDKDTQRTPAKRACFGIIYGIGGRSLYDQLRMMGIQGWSVDRCNELIYEWLKLYKGVDSYIRRVSSNVRRRSNVPPNEDGYATVYDCWGMPRSLPGIWSEDAKIAAEAGRHAVSHKIQGGAQGMIQNAMSALKYDVLDWQDYNMDIQWLIEIHDELDFEMDEDILPIVEPVILHKMKTCHGMNNMRVPVEVEGKASITWGGKE